MPNPIITLHVISHTHWDREWYLSHENFRAALVDLVDHVIDICESDADFKYFHLDGQTIVLEDYLEIRPQMEGRLRKLISDGRLLIGPWYLQNDEFLCDGESTIRNLLIGHRHCRAYHVKSMPVGYVPDQFGNISQLPQILRGFEIPTAVYGRGCEGPGRHPEFFWESPDGSRVLAQHLLQWYNNAQRLPLDAGQAVAMCQEIIAANEGRAQTGHLLLMNGVDHLEAQENLSECIVRANALAELSGLPFRLEHSTLQHYLQSMHGELAQGQIFRGELREGDEGSVLSGTASSRVHLKQANFEQMQNLRRWVEPFSIAARLAGSDFLAEDAIDYAWKTLIQNHPHDSICGCSIDEVHFQMEGRFRRVADVAATQLRRSLRYVASAICTDSMEHSIVVVFNAHPWKWSGMALAQIDLLEGEGDLRDFVLQTAEGGDVAFEIEDMQQIVVRVLNPKRLPKALHLVRHTVRVKLLGVPSLGYETLFLRAKTTWDAEKLTSILGEEGESKPTIRMTGSWEDEAAEQAPAVVGQKFFGPRDWTPAPYADLFGADNPAFLENEFLRVDIQSNGSLSITDKETGRRWKDQHLLEDSADIGNEYIYMPLSGSEVINSVSSAPNIRVYGSDKLESRATVSWTLPLPFEADESSAKRVGTVADYTVFTHIRLAAGARTIDFTTQIKNTVKDHRLRVLFPTDLIADTCHADSPFDLVERSMDLGIANRNNTHPMESLVAVSDGKDGVAVFSAGMPEYEVLPNRSTIALTLLRCVDLLGDMPPAGYEKEQLVSDFTPDAQCLRDYTFRYAWRPFTGPAPDADLKRHCDNWLHAPRVFQVPVRRNEWLGYRPGAPKFFDYFEDEHSLPEVPRACLPLTHSMLEIDAPHVVISALKFPENFGGAQPVSRVNIAGPVAAVLRLVNMSGGPVTAAVTSSAGINIANLINMAEGNSKPLAVSDNTFTLTFKPKQVLTVYLEFRRLYN